MIIPLTGTRILHSALLITPLHLHVISHAVYISSLIDTLLLFRFQDALPTLPLALNAFVVFDCSTHLIPPMT